MRLLGLALLLAAPASTAHAGVFDTPHFAEPGQWSLGIEPELILSNGAGLAANARFQYGLTDLNTANFILGTGGGPRRFRVGGNLTFDFFPDIDDQPGIGVATQAIFYRTPSGSLLELTAIPYIHKTFFIGGGKKTAKGDRSGKDSSGETKVQAVDPFFAMPIGWTFADSKYTSVVTAVVGSSFRMTENMRYIFEFGISVNNAETYVSGGFVYSR